MKIKLLLWKLRIWLDKHTPVLCASCRKTLFKKDAVYERTTTGVNAPLCKPCHVELFHPFTKDE
jgi:hypothetical protein